MEIIYAQEVVTTDIPRLSKSDSTRIKAAIEKKLTTDPATFGRPLRKSLRGYRKLRVGDYRIIFRIHLDKVNIFVIQHRSVVYTTANRRTLK